MKSLVQYISEASKTFKNFKIDDLDAELETNKVSKSRRREIINFFKKVLGEGPYYCVSRNNPEKKSIDIWQNLEKKEPWFTDEEIDKWDDATPERKEEWRKDGADKRKRNEMIDKLSPSMKDKFMKLSEMNGLKLPKGAFKFGYRGTETYLEAIIAYIDNDFVLGIKQDTSRAKNTYEYNEDALTFYFAEKDIK